MYDFWCAGGCGNEIHLAAAYEKWSMAERALDLLGWQQRKGQWVCAQCAARGTQPLSAASTQP